MTDKKIIKKIVRTAVRTAQKQSYPRWNGLSELEIVKRLIQFREENFHECGVEGGKHPSWIFNTHNFPKEINGYIFHFHGGLEVMEQVLKGNFTSAKAYTYPDWEAYSQGWDCEEIDL